MLAKYINDTKIYEVECNVSLSSISSSASFLTVN